MTAQPPHDWNGRDLGAPLARLELRVAVEMLLAETTGVALASDAPLRRETYPGNGFIAVPLNITKA